MISAMPGSTYKTRITAATFISVMAVCYTSTALSQLQSGTTSGANEPPPLPAQVAVIKESEEARARERETEADEDPLKQRQKTKVDTPIEHVTQPNEISAYASLRARYRWTGSENKLDDGGSRIGGDGNWQFIPKYWLSGRVEIGFNLLNHLDALFDPGSSSSEGKNDDIFLRLLYANIETPKLFAVIGKAWSTYYAVAGFTDRFQGTGASASGAYNAGTDGGPSGTGRADEVLQTRLLIEPSSFLFRKLKPFNLNIQFQKNQEIPIAPEYAATDGKKLRYGNAIGLSALLETRDNFNIGIAYNLTKVKDEDRAVLEKIGIDGDDEALLIGGKWFSERWYLAMNVSWMWNHMATNEGIFFDGQGWETYAQYNLHNRWWAIAGWNYLKPYDSQQQVGNYEVKYGILGLRYSIQRFNKMLYANIRFDGSATTDDSEPDISNIYTIGVRWDFP
jgi:predicted porin